MKNAVKLNNKHEIWSGSHVHIYAISLRLTRTYFMLRQNVKTCSCTENTRNTLHTDKKKNSNYEGIKVA